MSYAVQNKNGEHLGFLFLAGEESKVDCISRSLQNKPELFKTEESELLYSFQEQGEFNWEVIDNSIEISNQETGSSAIIKNGILSAHGLIFNIVEMGAS